MPFLRNALIEGYPKPGTGDRHVLTLEKRRWLYELYNAHVKERPVERRFDRDLGYDD